jgi:hypothetical protein
MIEGPSTSKLSEDALITPDSFEGQTDLRRSEWNIIAARVEKQQWSTAPWVKTMVPHHSSGYAARKSEIWSFT